MEPVYAILRADAGEEGVLYTYCGESYLLAPVEKMAQVLHQAPNIFEKLSLRLGYGPGKTELILPHGCPKSSFPFPLNDPQVAAHQVVACFKACLGVPRHFTSDPAFTHSALHALGVAHDRLLDLREEIADEDPFTALRLLQTCGISRCGHVLSAVPPHLVQAFAVERDEALATTFATIQQSPTTEESTHTQPVGAGGFGLTSLASHATGGYLGAFYRIAGPLQQRLSAMGGSTNQRIAAVLQNPSTSKDTL